MSTVIYGLAQAAHGLLRPIRASANDGVFRALADYGSYRPELSFYRSIASSFLVCMPHTLMARNECVRFFVESDGFVTGREVL